MTSRTPKKQLLKKEESKHSDEVFNDDNTESEDEESQDEEQPSTSASKKVKNKSVRKTHADQSNNTPKKNKLPASGAVMKEIRRLQYSTKLIFPRAPFARVVREITQQYGEYKYHSLALEAIQEATELFLVGYIADCYQLTRHRKRQTLDVEDSQMLSNLLMDLVPGLRPL